MQLSKINPSEVRLKLGEAKNLPTLPEVVQKLLKLGSDPTAQISEVANVISQDPPLVSAVMKVVNSAFMGMGRQVDDLNKAIMTMGFNEVKRVALSVKAMDLCKVNGQDSEFVHSIWKHSFATAHVSKTIAIGCSAEMSDQAYISGLLHHVGKIFFASYYTEVYVQLLNVLQGEGGDDLKLEMEVFGLTHADAGRSVCTHWKLPGFIKNVCHKHHQPEALPPESQILGLCVASASQLTEDFLKTGHLEEASPGLTYAKKLLEDPCFARTASLDSLNVSVKEGIELYDSFVRALSPIPAP